MARCINFLVLLYKCKGDWVFGAGPRSQTERLSLLFDASSQSIRDVGRRKSLKRMQPRVSFGGCIRGAAKSCVSSQYSLTSFLAASEIDESGPRRNRWQATPEEFLNFITAALIKTYKAKLADELREAGLYSQVDSAGFGKKFVVDNPARRGMESRRH